MSPAPYNKQLDGALVLGQLGISSRGRLFGLPHPAIHLTASSVELHDDKQQEEHDWRALWEYDTAAAS